MLTIVYGNMGAGKTLFLTAIASFCKNTIISNYQLDFKFTDFELITFIEGKYENSLILLDEAYNYIESRLSPSLKNRFMSYMLFQSRKKNIEMFMSAQLMSSLDLRYRNLADTIVLCKGYTRKGFEYSIVNVQSQRMVSLFLSLEKAKELFTKYNTNEVIEPQHSNEELIAFAPLAHKNEIVDKAVKAILVEYANQKITQYMIKDFMFVNDYPSSIMPYVYARVKVSQAKSEDKPKKKVEKKK